MVRQSAGGRRWALRRWAAKEVGGEGEFGKLVLGCEGMRT